MFTRRKTLNKVIQKERRLWHNTSKESKRKRSVKIVKGYLLGQEAYSLLSKNGGPLLHVAAREGQEGLVKRLLSMGTDPNLRGAAECTALHEAAARGHTHIMRLLIISGADVMARTSTGQTPLHWAADVGHFSAVLLLLAAGAEVGATSAFGYTAHHFAEHNHHQIIARLLQYHQSTST